jgi:hypothetical protein
MDDTTHKTLLWKEKEKEKVTMTIKIIFIDLYFLQIEELHFISSFCLTMKICSFIVHLIFFFFFFL